MKRRFKQNSIFLGLSLLIIAVLAAAVTIVPKGELHLLLCNRHSAGRDLFYRYYTQVGEWVPYAVCAGLLCNTATAAGLAHAQKVFDVPIIGVVEPGARAAAMVTRNRKVGVIATDATVNSNAYSKAIRHIDAGITVFSTATPRFVEIVERGVRMAEGPIENYMSLASKAYIRSEFEEIARDYLEPLRRCGVDTLVLGCTHFPIIKALIGGVVGRDVTLISSAKEAARDVSTILERRHALAQPGNAPHHEFYTTGDDVDGFRHFGSRVFNTELEFVEHLDLPELQ